MKAYKLYCTDDDHGAVVVFAESAKAARHMARPEMCDCEFVERRCKRAPDFDDASNPPTIAEYLSRGWYWECSGCGKDIYEEDKPLILENHAFHSIECVKKCRGDIYEYRFGHESIRELYQLVDGHLAWGEFSSIK